MKKNEKKTENTIDNAKVLSKYYYFYTAGSTGYIHEGDGLLFVTVTGHIVNFKNGEIVTTFEDGNGNIYRRTEDESQLYGSTSDYKTGNAVCKNSVTTHDMLRRADERHLRECSYYLCEDEESGKKYCYCTAWVFNNGEAKEVPLVVNIISYDRNNGWSLVDGSIPDKFWESREDAYAFNEFKVIDKDGEEFVEQGYLMRLQPTPEQWEIINQLRDLIKKAKEANIKFLYDRDNYCPITALNMNNVDLIGYNVESVNGGDIIALNNIPNVDTKLDVYDYCGCDDNDQIVLKPTPRQRKEWLKAHPEKS